MEEIAQVYSRALFEVAKQHGKLDDVREQLGQFTDALEQNRDLAVFFFSPYFSSSMRRLPGLTIMPLGSIPLGFLSTNTFISLNSLEY